MSAQELLRRYLRQRAELGEAELVLDRLHPGELAALLDGVPAAATALAPSGPLADAPPLVQLGDWDQLRTAASACEACGLSGTRQNVVLGEGNPAADLVVVGEAPGADEDRTGRPFVGRAGKMLDLLLASIGLEREQVYICNVLKCRPPGNRNPEAAEIESCSPFLRRQLELVQPRAVLAVGGFAAQTLLGTDVPIGRLRGTAQRYQDVPLVATYHPAALLRNPSWIRPVWEDLQRLRSLLDRV